MKCKTEGCDNVVRKHQSLCDDCIVERARKLKRQRETTESGIRGGQGRSGAEVEQSSIGAAVALGIGLLVGLVLLASYTLDAAKDAGRTEEAAQTVLDSNNGEIAGREPRQESHNSTNSEQQGGTQ